MTNTQVMINQINGVITLLDEKDRTKLPEAFKSYFMKNASISPDEAIDFTKTLNEQDFSDETKIMLVYINQLLKK